MTRPWLLAALFSVACAHAASPPALHGQLLRTDVAGGAHEVPDTQAVVGFQNDGERPCSVRRYAIRWGTSGPLSGTKSCAPAEPVVVAPHAGAETTCTIASTTQVGGAPGLSSATATIEGVEADCWIER